MASSKPRITEAHVQKSVTDLLVLDGWRAIRTDPVSDRSRGKGFGEVGMPDYLYIRYAYSAESCEASRDNSSCPWDINARLTHTKAFYVEFKRPGAKPKPHQLAWHASERARGALVLVVDDIDDFMRYYKNSGLCRNVLK